MVLGVSSDYSMLVRRRLSGVRMVRNCNALARRLTIGWSDRGGRSFGEPRRESMIGIKCLRLTLVKPRVAQPHR
jgi:hypothetical protein